MSKFLPEDFDADKPLALIAGRDTYPALFAERARAAGIPVRLIELQGETSPELIESFLPEERATVKVGQVGKLLKVLKKFAARIDDVPYFVSRDHPHARLGPQCCYRNRLSLVAVLWFGPAGRA